MLRARLKVGPFFSIVFQSSQYMPFSPGEVAAAVPKSRKIRPSLPQYSAVGKKSGCGTLPGPIVCQIEYRHLFGDILCCGYTPEMGKHMMVSDTLNPSRERKAYIGTAMFLGTLCTLALMVLCGAPLLSFSSNDLLADVPWTALWVIATLVARWSIQRSIRMQAWIDYCSKLSYGRFLSEETERGINRFLSVLFRGIIAIVFLALVVAVTYLAFLD